MGGQCSIVPEREPDDIRLVVVPPGLNQVQRDALINDQINYNNDNNILRPPSRKNRHKNRKFKKRIRNKLKCMGPNVNVIKVGFNSAQSQSNQYCKGPTISYGPHYGYTVTQGDTLYPKGATYQFGQPPPGYIPNIIPEITQPDTNIINNNVMQQQPLGLLSSMTSITITSGGASNQKSSFSSNLFSTEDPKNDLDDDENSLPISSSNPSLPTSRLTMTTSISSNSTTNNRLFTSSPNSKWSNAPCSSSAIEKISEATITSFHISGGSSLSPSESSSSPSNSKEKPKNKKTKSTFNKTLKSVKPKAKPKSVKKTVDSSFFALRFLPSISTDNNSDNSKVNNSDNKSSSYSSSQSSSS